MATITQDLSFARSLEGQGIGAAIGFGTRDYKWFSRGGHQRFVRAIFNITLLPGDSTNFITLADFNVRMLMDSGHLLIATNGPDTQAFSVEINQAEVVNGVGAGEGLANGLALSGAANSTHRLPIFQPAVGFAGGAMTWPYINLPSYDLYTEGLRVRVKLDVATATSQQLVGYIAVRGMDMSDEATLYTP